MQYAGYEFLRIIFPRTPVNKGDIEKDRSLQKLRSFRLRASNRSEGYLLSSRGSWLSSPSEGGKNPQRPAFASACCHYWSPRSPLTTDRYDAPWLRVARTS